MKKLNILYLIAIVSAGIIMVMCNKSKDDAIAPGYRDEVGGGGNPDPNSVTTTGTSTITNPATSNSTLNVGGAGWSFASCGAGNSLLAYNGATTVQINFFAPPSSGTYNLQSGTPTSNSVAQMIVYNAPGQPSSVVWYSASGMISVTTTTSGNVTATFNNIPCTQMQFPFPVVTVSGAMTCI
ncbi:MAG: hypothetical protein KatS3mg028_0976 [Bacteroidia bacterium]|nr:MAG: hypothetical protein KatS3mg028_0976 [Bacteroidia bacterium]